MVTGQAMVSRLRPPLGVRWALVCTLLAAGLVSQSGCIITRAAIERGGRDNVWCEYARVHPGEAPVVGRDGSVALPVLVHWNPAIARTRSYQRYFVLSANEIEQIWRAQAVDPGGKAMRVWLELRADKFICPSMGGPGRFVPTGTYAVTCSRQDLPPDLRDGRRCVVETVPEGGWELNYADDGSPVVVRLDGKDVRLAVVAGPQYTFRTPAGQVWRVFLVPIAVIGDILYLPFTAAELVADVGGFVVKTISPRR